MGDVKVWFFLFVILARVIQFAFWLSNREFLFILLGGSALIFIVSGLTHSDEMPADEAAEKTVKQVEKGIEKISATLDGEQADTDSLDSSTHQSTNV